MSKKLRKNMKNPELVFIFEMIAVIGLWVGKTIDILVIIVWMLLLAEACWTIRKNYKKCQYAAVLLFLSFSMECTMQILIEHRFVIELSYQKIIDFCLYLFVFILGSAITKRKTTGLLGTSIILYVVEITNFIVTFYRGKSIYFPDVFSMNTALDVAGAYSFPLTKAVVLCISIWIGNMFLILAFRKSDADMNERMLKRILVPASIILFFVIVVVFQIPTKFKLVSYYFSTTPHWLYSFAMSGYQMDIRSSQDYNADKPSISEKSDELKKNVEKPNIIFVMNEAFSDLRYISSFDGDDKVMPFYDDLVNSGASESGWLYTSIFGGNTANTEFEVLTGVSMNSLPDNTTSYNLYANDDTYSLATYFNELGYRTIGFHPAAGTNYYRNKVYPNLGFEEAYFQEDYNDLKRIRNYTSDESNYEKVIEFLETKEKDEKLFLFNVTVQSHSPFDFQGNGFENIDFLDDDSLDVTEQYLTCLNYSDKALKKFVQYLENYDEPTILVFFGDHQARIDDAFYEQLYGKSLTELSEDEAKQKYVVPYLIWSNYGLNVEKEKKQMSANYLGAYVVQQLGLPQTAQQKFLNNLREEYPIITSQGISKDGFHYLQEVDDENLSAYECVNYNLLFEEKKLWNDIFTLDR